GEGFVDGLLAAVGDQDLARLHLVTGVPGGLLDDGLLQFRQAGRGGVAVEARLAGSLDSGLDDVVGGRKVRLSGAEADHGAALRLHGLGLGVDGEGGGLGDGTDACGDTWSVSHGSMVSCVVPLLAAEEGPPVEGRSSLQVPVVCSKVVQGHILAEVIHACIGWCTPHGMHPAREPAMVETQFPSKGSGSIGRAPVSKTGCWGFESLLPCKGNTRGCGTTAASAGVSRTTGICP